MFTKRPLHKLWLGLLAGLVFLSPSPIRADTYQDYQRLVQRMNAALDAERYVEALALGQQMIGLVDRAYTNAQARFQAIRALGFDLRATGIYLTQEGKYPQAERALQDADDTFGRVVAKDHPDRAQGAVWFATLYQDQGRLADMEAVLKPALPALAKMKPDGNIDYYPDALRLLGIAYNGQGRYREAEESHRQALRLREQHYGPNHGRVADSLNSLGIVYQDTGRLPEAEQCYRRALVIREKVAAAKGDAKSRRFAEQDVAGTLANVALILEIQGRYAEAETLNKQALEIYKRTTTPEYHGLTTIYNNLGIVYRQQGRLAEAESCQRSVLDWRKQHLDAGNTRLADSHCNLGAIYQDQKRFTDAEASIRQALTIYEKAHAGPHESIGACYSSLGSLFLAQGRFPEAEKAINHALETREKTLGPAHPDCAGSLLTLARLYFQQGRLDEMRPTLERVIDIYKQAEFAPGWRFQPVYLRAQLHRRQGQKTEAFADLEQALALAEVQQSYYSGSDQDRARSFASLAEAFDTMIAWQLEAGNIAEVLRTMERARARTLLEEINLRGADLLAGLPADQVAALRRREQDARTQIAAVEKQLDLLVQQKDLSDDQRQQRQEPLLVQLAAARRDYLAAYGDVRNASPAYRLTTRKDRQPIGLAELQKWVGQQAGLLLEYHLGSEQGHVLVVPAAGTAPHVEKLHLSPEQAAVLGTEPGPLTAGKMLQILCNDQDTGLLQRLNREQTADQETNRLAALWQVLVPASERAALTAGELKRLLVLPDGPLAWLPFEALVVQPGKRPQYLLDVGPPVVYGASATVQVNLARRPVVPPAADKAPVLSISDPLYGSDSRPAAGSSRASVLDSVSARSRYTSDGGRLNRLPYSGTESDWVVSNFQDARIETRQLRREQATEANVRAQVPGRRMVHFACHGQVDRAHGNFFGALALTPGPTGDPANDGFLTLPELYELNLGGCELAILSACATNYGPQQRGEGVWALSRGFLVAGARRVLASNWVVDDEAMASLVSYFSSCLTYREKKGQPLDYATAAWEAKRWLRQQEKWQSPYFWASLVLVGPD